MKNNGQNLKKGDKVFYSSDDETFFGTLGTVYKDDKGIGVEVDIELVNGNVVSPVDLECCTIISGKMFKYGSYLEDVCLTISNIAHEKMGMKWSDE